MFAHSYVLRWAAVLYGRPCSGQFSPCFTRISTIEYCYRDIDDWFLFFVISTKIHNSSKDECFACAAFVLKWEFHVTCHLSLCVRAHQVGENIFSMMTTRFVLADDGDSKIWYGRSCEGISRVLVHMYFNSRFTRSSYCVFDRYYLCESAQ